MRSKIEQSSLSVEKTGTVAPDPVFQQTVLQGSSELTENKPLVLGSLDVPGTANHQEIEVLAELVPLIPAAQPAQSALFTRGEHL